ncbi:MAG TPA: PQQ-binding-like beta-propeller repeat protein, partial [Ktedonobacterales bacterium]
FDASSGTQRWQFQEPQGIGLSQPVLDSGVVYAIDGWGVYAFDAGGGAQRWSVQMQSMGNMDLLAMNDLLYFLTVSGASGQQTIEALDVSNGAKRWSWSPTATALAAPGASTFAPLSGALPLAYTTGNGGVYVWYNGKVIAMNGENGTQQWQAPINPGSPQVGVMVVG